MLTASTPISITSTMLDEMARHLRLSSPGSVEQTADVEAVMRDAIAHLEARLALCLSPRRFTWRGYLDGEGRARAPIGPVRALIEVKLIRPNGDVNVLDVSDFEVDQLETRPLFCGSTFAPDELEFTFDAGFGTDWNDAPPDVRRATLLLGAHYFDKRHATGEKIHPIPHGVAVLTAPWRPVRLSARRSA